MDQPKINIHVPTVPIADTQGFAKVWTYKGIAVPLQEQHVQFANDYANLVLRAYITQATLQALAAQEAAKPKIIMEGIPDGRE